MSKKLKNENAAQLIGSFVAEANMINKKIERISKVGIDIRKMTELHKQLIGMSGRFDKVVFIDSRGGFHAARPIEVSRIPMDFREKLIAILVEDIMRRVEELKLTILKVSHELTEEFPTPIKNETGEGSGQPAA